MPSLVISRYLVREFATLLLPILAAFIILYLIVDFFDRLDFLLRNHATVGSALRYFAFKMPLIITEIMPPAVLAAMMLSLGMVSRRNEIIALRASGVSLMQTALPLLGLATVISLGMLAWDETVVPSSTRAWQNVINVEIRKSVPRSIFSEHQVWYHGADGFYNIEQVPPRGEGLVGLTVYRTNKAFELQSIIEVPFARWTGAAWENHDAVEHAIGPAGEIVTQPLPPDRVIIHETLSDFFEVRRQPEELSYQELRRRIQELMRKGIASSSDLVDLQMKLAVPFTSLVLAGVAIPLAGRVRRHPSLEAIVGLGLVIGFPYWVVLALSNALGESTALPAAASAWAANIIFSLVGTSLFLSFE